MKTTSTIASVFVDDQAKALDLYTGPLGFGWMTPAATSSTSRACCESS
jgi:hypothetical protein